uniref:Uncharacterized protein n=1 Tax=Noctiluca scintillans TaxID=2966 RepID=A0A7S1AJT6_NOCSC
MPAFLFGIAVYCVAFKRRWSERRGHIQLGVRGLVTTAQAVLTIVLVVGDVDMVHNLPLIFFLAVSAASLFVQCFGGDPRMFVVRSIPSFFTCCLMLHNAVCGRPLPWDHGFNCFYGGWVENLWFCRLLHVIDAIRYCFDGLSLVLHYLLPHRGVSETRGNEQFWYRARVRVAGVGIHLCRGFANIEILTGTPNQRSHLEITSNFVRCLLVLAAATSLHRQWLTSGTRSLPTQSATSTAGSKGFNDESSSKDDLREPLFSVTRASERCVC